MSTITHSARSRKQCLAVAYAFAVFILALPFLFSFYVVTGDSMAPVYKNGQIILVERYSRFIVSPARGEVLVLRNPHKPSELVTKRVVGLPGERVVVGENDLTLFYPDRTQEYFSSTTLMGGGSAFYNALQHNMALGSQDMYVLGDNRQTSLDSRAFGAVQQGDIIGRVLWRMPWITLQ